MLTPEHIAYNALCRAYDGDYQKIRSARGAHTSWQDAWRAAKKQFPKINAEDEWRNLENAGVRLVLHADAEYPALLHEIHDAPQGLYVRGAHIADDACRLAVVGTRKATSSGIRLAHDFAQALAEERIVITSGLAMGIDTAAHTGALDGVGITLAVLAGGLNDVYPAQNEQLAERIIAHNGALISEYPLGSPCYPTRFLERNRIVSGLSRGALIIEAPQKSGSLATASFALEQNRDVFVIPGPVTHPNYAGSHSLIKAGAALVTEPKDILDALGIAPQERLPLGKTPGASGASGEESLIIAAIKTAAEGVSVDKIAEMTKLETSAVNRNLTFLQLKGIIRESGGNYELQ